jgi:hypothetical protein
MAWRASSTVRGGARPRAADRNRDLGDGEHWRKRRRPDVVRASSRTPSEGRRGCRRAQERRPRRTRRRATPHRQTKTLQSSSGRSIGGRLCRTTTPGARGRRARPAPAPRRRQATAGRLRSSKRATRAREAPSEPRGQRAPRRRTHEHEIGALPTVRISSRPTAPNSTVIDRDSRSTTHGRASRPRRTMKCQ